MSALTRAEVLRARQDGFVPERQGRAGEIVSALLRRRPEPTARPWPPRKEEAPCCQARLDELGRPPLGLCTPECIRRPGNWAIVLEGRPIPAGGIPPRPTRGGP